MKIRNKICDLIDRGEKGYITIGDIGVATFYVVIITVIPYLMYCGLPVWKLYVIGELAPLSYFSMLEQLGFFMSLACITLFIIYIITISTFMIEELSKITVVKYKRKEK